MGASSHRPTVGPEIISTQRLFPWRHSPLPDILGKFGIHIFDAVLRTADIGVHAKGNRVNLGAQRCLHGGPRSDQRPLLGPLRLAKIHGRRVGVIRIRPVPSV